MRFRVGCSMNAEAASRVAIYDLCFLTIRCIYFAKRM